MMPPPWLAGASEGWRLDLEEHRASLDRGIGSAQVGGRWNPVGYSVIYCSADPATAILEVAVHKGLPALDRVRHVETKIRRLDSADVHVVEPDDVPNPNWLLLGSPSKAQQEFGRDLLKGSPFVLIPSAVSRESWNLLFNPDRAAGRYDVISQKRFALDTRLSERHPVNEASSVSG
jgi:RES domain-containing protein